MAALALALIDLEEIDGQAMLDEIVCLFMVLFLKEREYGVQPLFRERKTRGAEEIIMKDIQGDENLFRNYFRVSEDQFDNILAKVGADIEKKTTRLAEPVTARARLASPL